MKSEVRMSFLKSRAEAIREELCFSLNGEVVVAKNSPSISFGSIPFRQSSPASVAIVKLSSSHAATARSPGITIGMPDALAISSLLNLHVGMYAP